VLCTYDVKPVWTGLKTYRFHGMASSMLMFPHLTTDGSNVSQQRPYRVIAWEHTVDHSL